MFTTDVFLKFYLKKLILIYRIFWNVRYKYILPRNVRNIMRINIRNLLLNKLIYISNAEKAIWCLIELIIENLKIWGMSRVGISISALIAKQVLIMYINFLYKWQWYENEKKIWSFSLEFYPFFFFFFTTHVKDFITFRIKIQKKYGKDLFKILFV